MQRDPNPQSAVHPEGRLSRRALLQQGAIVPIGGALALSLPAAAASGEPNGRAANRGDDRPRNIIWMVSDGMSAGVPAMAEAFSQLVRGKGTTWFELARRGEGVHHGLLETGSLSSAVTDSAAAATAWSSGSQVFNGSLNVLPDGTKLTPFAPLMRDRGKALGLVTTTKITHATPAGYAAVTPDRDLEHDIAPQYIGLVDVALGGGRKFFDPAMRPDGADVYERYRSKGYTVCTTRAELRGAANANRILGCFRDDHLPYTIDQHHRPHQHTEVPSLAEMTRTALGVLDRKPNGFFLMVEGGRIDHAAHNNDAAGMLWDQLAFDDALAEVLEYAADRDDTLIVVTTDHGNANPGLNGMGSRYNGSSEAFARLGDVNASFEAMHGMLRARTRGGELSIKDVAEFVEAHAGFTPDADEAGAIADAFNGRPFPDLHRQDRGLIGAIGQTFANHTGVGWTGITHTSDGGLLMATGPGSHRFGRQMPHCETRGLIADLWSITHQNPSMSKGAARRYLTHARPMRHQERDTLLALS